RRGFMTQWIANVLGVAALGIVAVLILAFRNRSRSKKLARKLRERLSNREGYSDSELISVFPLQREQEIAVKFRTQLSKALGIEPDKIHPDDDSEQGEVEKLFPRFKSKEFRPQFSEF